MSPLADAKRLGRASLWPYQRPFASYAVYVLAPLALACEPSNSDANRPEFGSAKAALLDASVQGSVALLNAPGEVFCSGSLVSPLVVLTAAHCVFDAGIIGAPFAVFAGSDANIGGQYARVLQATTHPEYEPFAGRADLALLRIAGELDAAALPLAQTAPEIGQPVAFVGYGASAEGPVAYRHSGSSIVTRSEGAGFWYEPGTCAGDSGGPVLETTPDGDRVTGVVASGDLWCARARASSVSAHMTWLADNIQALDPSACRGENDQCGAACPFGDPDCACVEDGRCLLCDGADPDCSSACVLDGTCAEHCVAPDPDCFSGEPGVQCSEDSDCASALCLDERCRQRCGADARYGCPPWLECTAVSEEQSACLALPAPASAGCTLSPRATDPAVLMGLAVIALTRLLARRRSGTLAV